MTARHGLEIRAATAVDAPGLSLLLGAAGHAIAPHDLAERLKAIHQGPGAALVALDWGPPSGLVLFHWYRTLGAAKPTAQITTLLVGIDDRRRGIGRLLVKAAAQAARIAGCGALEFLVPPDVPSLQAFCRATGFGQAGPRYVRPLRKTG